VRLTLAIIALVAAGCSLLSPAMNVGGRTFLSTAVAEDGVARQLVAGTTIRVTFGNDGNVGVNAGCNTMGGAFRIEGGVLHVTGAGMTEMACDPDLMAQDAWVFAFFGAEPTVSLSGSDLVLSSGGTVVRFLDREIAEPDAPLVGPTWTVVSVIAGGAVASVPQGVAATLTFRADGQVDVATGCNRGGGSFEVDGVTIRFGSLSLTKMACSGAAGELETAVLAVLGAGSVTFGIDATRLSLHAGDRGLDLATERF
jgi:heat shock protein HslJ